MTKCSVFFLWLFSLSRVPSPTTLFQMAKFHSFLYSWVYSHVYICVCVCVRACVTCVFTFFFIHSSLNGHLGGFHILAIVNNAPENNGVCVSFQISIFGFFSVIYPGVEVWGPRVVLFLTFWETSVLFSTVAAPVDIPTNCVQDFPFLHILAHIYYLRSSWW